MNRQVGPSIVLSVLIVCFFAVALYQHDTPRPVRSSNPPALDQPRDASDGGLPVSHAVSTRSGVDQSNEWSLTTVSSSSLPHIRDVQFRNVHQAVRASNVASSQRNVRPVTASPPTAIRTSRPAPSGRAHDPTASVRRPEAAFTIVENDETISDVALRVYGTTQEVDALRQANLDSLPTNDMTLSAGMLLRTPRLR